MPPLNPSEQLVFEVSQHSFLSLWCYNNPRGSNGKELCDVLVLCGETIILISVKEIGLKRDGDPKINSSRWKRKAVEASVNQLYGAERALVPMTRVVRMDGTDGLDLPPNSCRRVHRVAVAFGSNDESEIASADFGKGFVHVMNEASFQEILRELDTISDLIDYFEKKEAFAGGNPVSAGSSELGLLASFLQNNRNFPDSSASTFEYAAWGKLQANPVFVDRKRTDQVSYAWDQTIEFLAAQEAKHENGYGPDLNQLERVIRSMALEDRFHRRVLGDSLVEFLRSAAAKRTDARIAQSRNGVIYVYLFLRPERREEWELELTARCQIARHLVGSGVTVVGIGIGEKDRLGSPSTLVYMDVENWSASDDALAEETMQRSGFFVGVSARRVSHEEY